MHVVCVRTHPRWARPPPRGRHRGRMWTQATPVCVCVCWCVMVDWKCVQDGGGTTLITRAPAASKKHTDARRRHRGAPAGRAATRRRVASCLLPGLFVGKPRNAMRGSWLCAPGSSVHYFWSWGQGEQCVYPKFALLPEPRAASSAARRKQIGALFSTLVPIHLIPGHTHTSKQAHLFGHDDRRGDAPDVPREPGGRRGRGKPRRATQGLLCLPD